MAQTVGKIHIGKETVVIFDHGALCLWADIFTELEEVDGVVKITFASVHKNGDGIHKASVAVRIRMPKDAAWKLCRDLRALEG